MKQDADMNGRRGSSHEGPEASRRTAARVRRARPRAPATVARRTLLGLLVAAQATLPGCGAPEPPRPLTEVTVQLTWKHQAQFAGLYAAIARGYYEKAGLRVTLVPRTDPGVDVLAPLLSGEADFTVTYAMSALTARAAGKPVVAVAALYQRAALVFIALDGTGIRRPEDFVGRRMRRPTPGATTYTYRAMMRRAGVDPARVRYVDSGYDLAPFLSGDIDIWPGYLSNEVLSVRRAGRKPVLVFPDDFGVHQYGDALMTTERTVRERRQMVRRFVRATLRGWEWAIENPAEAAGLALRHDPRLDADHQAAMLRATVPLIHTGEHPVGWMEHSVWAAMQRVLVDQGLVPEDLDARRAYTQAFLREIYPGVP